MNEKYATVVIEGRLVVNKGRLRVIEGWNNEVWLWDAQENRMTPHIFKGENRIDDAIEFANFTNGYQKCDMCGNTMPIEIMPKRGDYWYCYDCLDEIVGHDE